MIGMMEKMKTIQFKITVERVGKYAEVKMLVENDLRVQLTLDLDDYGSLEAMGHIMLSYVEHAMFRELGSKVD